MALTKPPRANKTSGCLPGPIRAAFPFLTIDKTDETLEFPGKFAIQVGFVGGFVKAFVTREDGFGNLAEGDLSVLSIVDEGKVEGMKFGTRGPVCGSTC